MRKNLGIVLSCAAVCTLLVGCSIPGVSSRADDDNFDPDGSYYSSENSGEDKTVNYSWVLEPSVHADNIIVFDSSQTDPDNESNTAYIDASVVYRNGMYGFIDYAGNIIVHPAYSNFYTSAVGEMVLYNVTNEETGEREYCTLDSQGQVLNYVKDYKDYSPDYYWNSDEKAVYVKDRNEDRATRYTGKKTVVVSRADISDVGNGWFEVKNIDESAFALAKEDELILDFEYTDYYAPAFKGAGLTAIALERDGKWGYVSSSGEEIIPFKCDGILSSYSGSLIDNAERIHPYLFTEEFVPVSIGSTYGYYNIDGECVVSPGEFEQARPVHNGRAWVRKNGMWGIIQLGEIIEEEESSVQTSMTTTTVTSFTWSSSTTTTTTTTSVTSSAVTSSKKTTAISTDTVSSAINTESSAPPAADSNVTDDTVTNAEPIVPPVDSEPDTPQ